MGYDPSTWSADLLASLISGEFTLASAISPRQTRTENSLSSSCWQIDSTRCGRSHGLFRRPVHNMLWLSRAPKRHNVSLPPATIVAPHLHELRPTLQPAPPHVAPFNYRPNCVAKCHLCNLTCDGRLLVHPRAKRTSKSVQCISQRPHHHVRCHRVQVLPCNCAREHELVHSFRSEGSPKSLSPTC